MKAATTIVLLPVNRIELDPMGRPINQEAVQHLVGSIAELGLLNPITVIPRDEVFDGGGYSPGHRVVAGRHRFSACCKLGWETVPCIVLEGEHSIAAEMATLDENLLRTDMDAAARTTQLVRRKELYDALRTARAANRPAPRTLDTGGTMMAHVGTGPHGDSTAAGDRPATDSGELAPPPKSVRPPPNPKGFAAETADAIGGTKRDINRALKFAEVLGADTVRQLSGTSLGSARELAALVKLSPEDREPYIRQAIAGEKVSVQKKPKAPKALSAKALYPRIASGLEKAVKAIEAAVGIPAHLVWERFEVVCSEAGECDCDIETSRRINAARDALSEILAAVQEHV